MPTDRPWYCCHCDCDEWLNAGGSGSTYGNIAPVTLNSACATDGCVELLITFTFASNRIAGAMVGSGNYTPSSLTAATAGPWVLFNRGGEPAYDRDGSRPVPCSVEMAVHPTDADLTIVIKVSLNNEFVWERRSMDPDSEDFLVFDLTSGEIDAPPFGVSDFCLNISTTAVRCAYVQDVACLEEEGGCNLEVAVTMDSEGVEPCDFVSPLCLESLGANALLDDWRFGGEWYGAGTGGAEDDCNSWFYLDIPMTLPDDCTAVLGSFQAWNEGCYLYGLWEDCSQDPRECPRALDFIITEGPGSCDGTLDDIACSCESGTNNCPPEGCPIQYCKWQWNVTDQEWDLVYSNCIAPSECPDEPAEPEDTDIPHVVCLCCTSIAPPLPCEDGFEPCLDQGGCTWWWQGTWDPLSPCSDITCECQGKPDDFTDPGAFIGEIRDGTCCIEM
jgi:hypothetical protein